ncbi:MAG TPA: hypothetical protein VFR61_00575 [Nitrososphaeraceae archaeon]|nr:hypothetical protein [Nitrososphaeraceae archaeon]
MESLLQSRRETGQHRKIKENSFYQTSMKFHMVPAEPDVSLLLSVSKNLSNKFSS